MRLDEKAFWRDYDEMTAIGAIEGGGNERLSMSDEDIKARALLISMLKKEGFAVNEDETGAIWARLEGSDPNAAAVLVGSHIDTVRNGGKYDGLLGVMMGFQAMRQIKDEGEEHKRAIELVVFPTEESAQFALPVEGVSTGSPALTPVINAMNKYPDAVVTIAHTGQVFNIRNAKINILFTYEMMQPHNLSYYNSCSMVFNMELEEKTLLFLGDAGGNSTTGTPLADMMEIYTSETLDADIVQVAHHGIDVADATDDFYELLTPDYLLVPCASEYTKVGGKYVRLAECSAYKTLTSSTKYLAGSSVTVLTIDNGSVLAQTYDDVSAYKNSTGG